MKTPDPDAPADFFISYNKADTLWVDGLGNWLDQALFTSVSQSQDFVAGSNFVSEMNAALECAKRFIAVASPDYFAAQFPEAEWTAAFARDPTGAQRTLILVRVRECKIPALLKPLVYIDLVGLNHIQARERFIAEIKASLADKRVPQRRRPPARTEPTIGNPTDNQIHQEAHGNGNVQVGRDYIRTEKHTIRNVIQPGPEHITDEQAVQIKAMIDDLAEIDVSAGRPDSHGEWYSRLYRNFPCRNSYHLIYREDFPAVMTYLSREAAKARPKLRRTNNEEWRRRFTRAIWAQAGSLGMSHEEVHQLATERLKLKKPLRSLNELGEQNLERFYRMIKKLRS